MNEIEKYLLEICRLNVKKAIFSNKRDKASKYTKTVIRLLENNKYQGESFTEKQAFHSNFEASMLFEKMTALFPNEFIQAEIFTDSYIYSAKYSKKGKLLCSRRKNDTASSVDTSHNRQKKYIIDRENLPPVFKDLGITDNDGKIINSKYDKFRQICRFTEQLDHVLSKDKNESIEIIDFGCGKSYLTFVIYFYITEILGKKVHITGLDLKADVIERCNALADKYGYNGMEFLCMDIKDYTPKNSVDMVISLHACDIATDYALYFAVKCKANYIFSVPCCHKEARSMMKSKSLTMLNDYGLIKERFCETITDALRAKLLEYSGYSVELCEFIDFDNSPKNMLIRAKKAPTADKFRYNKIKEQILAIKKEFGITITLEKLLFEKGI